MDEYEEKIPQPAVTDDQIGPQTSGQQDLPREDPESSRGKLTEDLVAGAASNLAVRGTLTFHFRDRDVPVFMDGYAAMRALTNIREGTSDWEDPLHPCFSDARNLWVTVRNRRLLGATWTPGNVDDTAFSIDPETA